MKNFEEIIGSKCERSLDHRIAICSSERYSLDEVVQGIDQGVLFVYATWSGHSALSFSEFCRAVAANPLARFQIVVVDTDDYADCFANILGDIPQGKGEAYWIRNGHVVYRDHGYHKKESLETLNSRILEFSDDHGRRARHA